jgi:hypothetical protein
VYGSSTSRKIGRGRVLLFLRHFTPSTAKIFYYIPSIYENWRQISGIKRKIKLIFLLFFR